MASRIMPRGRPLRGANRLEVVNGLTAGCLGLRYR